ncbi:MAG: S46 family peptidase, partial [Bacteroidales bacterium]|nr:S46 family peptidase [Bacteroidales bacterium]
MKRLISIALIALMTTIPVLANDGMWLPILLQYLNEKEMQEMGMKITADDIYSINHASMKDAVMLFGGGCTCEVVSNKGLLLTNYHCGYGSIQRHSAIDHDYLTNGFWAKDNSEELPCPGLTTNLMVEMRDVTERINNAVNDKMTQAEREKAIEAESQKIIKEA